MKPKSLFFIFVKFVEIKIEFGWLSIIKLEESFANFFHDEVVIKVAFQQERTTEALT